MRSVISASRRTDIPAFYSQWLLNRIAAGFAAYYHPFTGRRYEVSLAPDDVSCFVFWTKNLGPLLPALPRLAERYRFYIHFTITGLPRYLEPNVPPPEQTIAQFRQAAAQFGARCMLWRFDPIIFDQNIGAQATIARFDRLSALLEGYTERCYTSFVSLYARTLRNTARAGVAVRDPSLEEKLELLAQLVAIARERGMTIFSCCDDALVGRGVRKARCIDPELVRAIGAPPPDDFRPAPSRKMCGCYRSVDIGGYDLCPAGCLYCYANANPKRARAAWRAHDPQAPALLDPAHAT